MPPRPYRSADADERAGPHSPPPAGTGFGQVIAAERRIPPRHGSGRRRQMNIRELRQLLEHVDDTRELVVPSPGARPDRRGLEELRAVWSAARAEANLAYDAWREARGRESYSVYRAAEDRADAAEDALALAAGASGPVTTVTEKARGLNQIGNEAD